jgi:outer membrane protein assembly factor BamB
MMPPTAFNGSVFINAGYFDGVIFALDAVSGIRKWSQTSGTSEMNTPSSDGEFLYSYGGEMLHRLDPETGEIVARSGFETTGTQSGYFGAPIIGDKGMIVVLRGTGFSGWVFASSEPYEDRYLDGYRASDLSLRWQSVKQYRSFPAAAKGVIYATSNNPKSLDALDEETGQILWSWVPGPSDVTFHRNVVVTDTHVFVSTNRALYAIDLETHKSVWQQATPGMLSISPDRTLYVAEGTTMSSGTIQTYRLK